MKEEPASSAPRRLPALAVGLLLAALVLLVARWRGLTDTAILCYDESLYLLQGMSWAQGCLPGRDTWINKPPLLALIFASSYEAFGATTLPPRFLCYLALLGTSGLAFLLVARDRGRAGAVAAAVAVATLSSTELQPLDSVPGLSEPLFVFPLTLALWLVWPPLGPRGTWRCLGAGLLLGAATLIRQNGLIYVPLLLGGAAFPLPGERKSTAARRAVAFAAGFALAFVPVVVYFEARGCLAELVASTWTGPKEHHILSPQRLWKRGAIYLAGYFSSHALLSGVALVGLAAAAARAWRRGDRESRLRDTAVLAFFLASGASCVAGGRFYGHYLPMLAPAMALLVGAGVEALASLRLGRARPVALALGAAVLAGDVALATYHMHFACSRAAFAGLERPIERDRGALLAKIRELTRPGDRIFFLGSCPGLYYRAERSPASPDLAGEVMYFCRFLPGYKDRKGPAPGGGEETVEETLARRLREARLVLVPKMPPKGERWFSGESGEQWNLEDEWPAIPAVARCLDEHFAPLPDMVESVRLYVPRP